MNQPIRLIDGFNIEQATQTAYYLIECCNGQLTVSDFASLLYLANRRCLLEAGYLLVNDDLQINPTTGPFLWVTTALAEQPDHQRFIKAARWSPWLRSKAPGFGYWYEYIESDSKVLSLRKPIGVLGELSEHTAGLIEDISALPIDGLAAYVWDVCLEWRPEHKQMRLGTIDLQLSDLLMCGNLRRSEITEVVGHIEHVIYVHKTLGIYDA
jgi:hypothetical protein